MASQALLIAITDPLIIPAWVVGCATVILHPAFHLAAIDPLGPGAVVRATNEGTRTVTVIFAWPLHLRARAWFIATQVVSIGCWALFSAALGYSWRAVSLLTYIGIEAVRIGCACLTSCKSIFIFHIMAD